MNKLKSSVFFIIFCLFFQNIFSQNNNALTFYQNGISAMQRGDYYSAQELFNESLVLNPAYADAWFSLAEATYALNDFSLCLEYLENAQKFAKTNEEIINLRGMCLISLGRLNEAKEVFESILKTSPNSTQARFGLAEIELFNGSYNSSENYYLEALKCQNHDKKALLSLAILSEEKGDQDLAEKYITEAIRFHPEDAQVHFFASYIDAKNGKLKEAEKKARAAVQIDGNFTNAYIFLASILYYQNKFDDVLDICDFFITQNRNNVNFWYLKGATLNKKGDYLRSFDCFSTVLSIDPTDEIARSAIELLVLENFPVEDERRKNLADFHFNKGKSYSALFYGQAALFEYQRALRLDPNNIEGRLEYAELLNKTQLNEQYLSQLKFISQNEKFNSINLSDSQKRLFTKVNDTIETYDSLLKSSLSNKWNVEPFYLDKTRWNIGLYTINPSIQLLHVDSEEIALKMISEIFSSLPTVNVSEASAQVKNFGECFSRSRKNKQDYFIILKFEETEREVILEGELYNGRTGIKIDEISLFRTGNDKFSSILYSFRQNILENFGIKGKIIDRSQNNILVDLGKTDGIENENKFFVIKKGNLKTKDNEKGFSFDEKAILGEIEITNVSEEISEGNLIQNHFYDRVNIGDEVVLQEVSDNAQNQQNQNQNISQNQNAQNIIDLNSLELVKTPVFLELIRKIK